MHSRTNPTNKIKSTRADAAVTDRLRALAGELGPGGKLPTVRELCAQLETNVHVLNAALRELESRRLIYRKHAVGIFVSPDVPSRTILVILGSVYYRHPGASPFWDMLCGLLMQEAQSRAQADREHYAFHITPPDIRSESMLPPSITEPIRTGYVDGVVGVGLDRFTVDWIEQFGIPVVQFAGPASHVVEIDWRPLYTEGASYLAKAGCRNIAVWQITPNEMPRHSTGFEAELGSVESEIIFLQEAFSQIGAEFRPDWLRIPGFAGAPLYDAGAPSNQDQGYRAVTQTFSGTGRQKPDGVIIGDDLMTSGAVQALGELGLTPGREIQIVTMANTGSPILYGIGRSLFRLEIDPAEIRDALFSQLNAALGGGRASECVVIAPKAVAPAQRKERE